MSSSPSRALIAGGGIAGLATALAFQQRGWDVRVFEQAEALREVGAGIQLSPNGMKVLRALGLERAVLERGFLPEALEMRMGESGRKVFSLPIRTAAPYRWRAPYVHIHRADLIDILAGALSERAPDALRLGAAVESVSDDGKTLTLKGGERVEGSAVLAADGLRSALRRQVFGLQPARYTGMIAWRATVPLAALGEAAPPPTACVWAGEGRHVVTYHLSRRGLVNVVGVVEQVLDDPAALDSWQTEGRREDALDDFAGWDPVITRLFAAAPNLSRWALFDRPASPDWVAGSMALVGDAAHPMLPTFAQGACQGLEDAWAVAALASGSASIPEALSRYAALRQPRTAMIQQRALRNATNFHLGPGRERRRRYAAMALGGRLLPWLARGRLDEIYGYDAVQEAAAAVSAASATR